MYNMYNVYFHSNQLLFEYGIKTEFRIQMCLVVSNLWGNCTQNKIRHVGFVCYLKIIKAADE